ncbi:dTDP-4-amino-4,6-dideoxygalactose transaminase [Amycolatopsis marina]|uniref:dTDP-4-amino-4,6-dideoxygalactose transaminase n=1 Tax=Amycolatopsis marina TaxID=490629 RepID=A0A1I0WTR2_9PSEU|nr:DegT/DnrJ/EryC1/StrS family aminotransferase [Amycolatopsis marina]SFA92149.1 dTDP-4-amino-4,6-dideoxygalactose transaminase [Amycolatopsis marina]
MTRSPAILGGVPVRTDDLPVARPTLHTDTTLLGEIHDVLGSGMLTNGREVAKFERAVADFLEVEQVVAVSNCTTGLLLVLKCLGIRGQAVLPSFTFMATGHAAVWNGLEPVWADSDPRTCTLSPRSVAQATTAKTAVVLGVHTFGSPCDVDNLEVLTGGHGVPLVLDSAHAFGSRYRDGRPVGGRGTAEVFSLSPTKPLTTGEGGLISTNDAGLAAELRVAREYGNPGDYDSRFTGLNGRMGEIPALLGTHNLRHLPEVLDRRRGLAERYRERLAQLNGIAFPETVGQTTFKDFVILVDPADFGLSRTDLAAVLRAERISTRAYFDPPLHRQRAYREHPPRLDLPGTEYLAGRALTLPLFAHMGDADVDQVCEAVEAAYEHSAAIIARLPQPGTRRESSPV